MVERRTTLIPITKCFAMSKTLALLGMEVSSAVHFHKCIGI